MIRLGDLLDALSIYDNICICDYETDEILYMGTNQYQLYELNDRLIATVDVENNALNIDVI